VPESGGPLPGRFQDLAGLQLLGVLLFLPAVQLLDLFDVLPDGLQLLRQVHLYRATADRMSP